MCNKTKNNIFTTYNFSDKTTFYCPKIWEFYCTTFKKIKRTYSTTKTYIFN